MGQNFSANFVALTPEEEAFIHEEHPEFSILEAREIKQAIVKEAKDGKFLYYKDFLETVLKANIQKVYAERIANAVLTLDVNKDKKIGFKDIIEIFSLQKSSVSADKRAKLFIRFFSQFASKPPGVYDKLPQDCMQNFFEMIQQQRGKKIKTRKNLTKQKIVNGEEISKIFYQRIQSSKYDSDTVDALKEAITNKIIQTFFKDYLEGRIGVQK